MDMCLPQMSTVLRVPPGSGLPARLASDHVVFALRHHLSQIFLLKICLSIHCRFFMPNFLSSVLSLSLCTLGSPQVCQPSHGHDLPVFLPLPVQPLQSDTRFLLSAGSSRFLHVKCHFLAPKSVPSSFTSPPMSTLLPFLLVLSPLG